MKKAFCMLLAGIIICAVFSGCSGDDYDYDYENDYENDNDNDYSYSGGNYKDHNGNGEYDFSDYLKDQDPDLYDSIKDRYDSLK